MSIPVLSPASATMPEGQIVSRRGESVAIIASYPPWRGLQLHSLEVATEYTCNACEGRSESAVVATAGNSLLVCPACYAYLSRLEMSVDIPEQRSLDAC